MLEKTLAFPIKHKFKLKFKLYIGGIDKQTPSVLSTLR